MKITNIDQSELVVKWGVRHALFAVVSMILCAGIAIAQHAHHEHFVTNLSQTEFAGVPIPDLPDVTLTTQDGRSVRLHDLLDNQLSIINFIYTSCTNVCPLTTANFLQLKQLAGDRDFQMISISIDPKRDTPARLRKFMQTQGALSPRWTFLTGSPRTIPPLLGGFGFYNVAVDDHSPGVVIWDGRTRQWTRLVSLPPPHILFEELQRFFPG